MFSHFGSMNACTLLHYYYYRPSPYQLTMAFHPILLKGNLPWEIYCRSRNPSINQIHHFVSKRPCRCELVWALLGSDPPVVVVFARTTPSWLLYKHSRSKLSQVPNCVLFLLLSSMRRSYGSASPSRSQLLAMSLSQSCYASWLEY